MSSSSSSHKLFKKLPELDAAANCILQIYFKDIVESSKLGKVDKIAKWRGAIKVINNELDAVHNLIIRTDEIPMTLISIDMFLKWHEDLGSIDHPWPEWKTALAPSKTDVANHKWLDIVERRYDYHQLGLPMPCVVPTPTPPAQETEMPMSDKGKWKVTEVEVEQMIVEGSHRMEVDDEGEEAHDSVTWVGRPDCEGGVGRPGWRADPLPGSGADLAGELTHLLEVGSANPAGGQTHLLEVGSADPAGGQTHLLEVGSADPAGGWTHLLEVGSADLAGGWIHLLEVGLANMIGGWTHLLEVGSDMILS
ncbi:hypothetical protein M404DRAFT_29596 [Pisolithus tinctorius Marx 270]|uniref:Uncharacterized protein n=1 Tax=Pisolithus tinctorius Marx 270 TaxID=870435 RepID=A0A0C3IUC0_PISTI|nr:hypothetical protein M404DRAFT_29596 [Pisolithus tinctorius Marx 270]